MKTQFLIISIFLLSSPTWSETLNMDDLVERNETYYKKFSDIPFIGEISDIESGKFVNGKEEGEWLDFFENGQLSSKENYKDGKEDGLWKKYFENGQLRQVGNFKDGKHEAIWKLT